MLADLGAEVIEIERPAGELGRTVGPEVGVQATFATCTGANGRLPWI